VKERYLVMHAQTDFDFGLSLFDFSMAWRWDGDEMVMGF
jgi:hypothetical protein